MSCVPAAMGIPPPQGYRRAGVTPGAGGSEQGSRRAGWCLRSRGSESCLHSPRYLGKRKGPRLPVRERGPSSVVLAAKAGRRTCCTRRMRPVEALGLGPGRRLTRFPSRFRSVVQQGRTYLSVRDSSRTFRHCPRRRVGEHRHGDAPSREVHPSALLNLHRDSQRHDDSGVLQRWEEA